MWFVIDTSEKGIVHLYYSSGLNWSLRTFSVQHALGVLECFQSLNTELKITKNDIRGVGLIQAKGTFTATRIAATIANTLGFAWQVPVVAISSVPTKPPHELFEGTAAGTYVLPGYSAPPSIGTKKTV